MSRFLACILLCATLPGAASAGDPFLKAQGLPGPTPGDPVLIYGVTIVNSVVTTFVTVVTSTTGSTTTTTGTR